MCADMNDVRNDEDTNSICCTAKNACALVSNITLDITEYINQRSNINESIQSITKYININGIRCDGFLSCSIYTK